MQNHLSAPLLDSHQTTYHLWQKISEIFLPIMLSDLGIDVSNTVNAYLFSRISPEENYSAAANLIYTEQILLVVVPSTFLYMLPALLYPKPENSSVIMTNAILFSFVIGVISSAIFLLSGDFFLLCGFSKAVCRIIKEYAYFFAPSLPFKMMATALSKAAPFYNRRDLQYMDSLLSGCLMSGFSLVFVNYFPLQTLSKVQTIGLSYLLGSIARFFLYTIGYAIQDRKIETEKGRVFESLHTIRWTTHKDDFFNMLDKGWKLCIQLVGELMALYCLSFLVSGNTLDLDILNVMNQYFMFAIIVPISLGVTALLRAQDLKRNGHYTDLISTVNIILFIATLYNSALLTIAMIIPEILVSGFMNPQENTYHGLSGNFRAMFAMNFIGLAFNSYKDIINMTYRGLNMNFLSMQVSLFGLWGIGFPLAALLKTCTSLGVAGIILGFNIGNGINGAFLLAQWLHIGNVKHMEAICDHESIRNKVDGFFYGCSVIKNFLLFKEKEEFENKGSSAKMTYLKY